MLTVDALKHIFPDTRRLAPKKRSSYSTNDIIPRNVIIVGSQSSVKTGTARFLAEIAVTWYGKDNVNIAYSKGSIEPLFSAIRNKLVNILICDDITLNKQSLESLQKFFQVRHVIEEMTGRTNGLVVTILITHRLYGIENPELRASVDLFIFMSSPRGFDKTATTQIIGKSGVALLENLDELKAEKDEDKSWGVCAYGRNIGLFYSKFAATDYLGKGINPKNQRNWWKILKIAVVAIFTFLILNMLLKRRRKIKL